MGQQPTVAVIAPGAMGAAVGARLVANGVAVSTWLDGRSEASAARSRAAGMQAVEAAEIARADILLSIVPPGEALRLAERLLPALAGGNRELLYVDCNAVSPQTAILVGEVVAGAGVRFVDAGIIGGPPKPGYDGPVLYASGPHADGLAVLAERGLRVKRLHGPVGAASGLKMSYAGITKGVTALGSAMMLAATRFGCAEELHAELAASQPALLKQLERSVPDMFAKAYRWVAEMEEIADFASEDAASREIYAAIARHYQRLAEDEAGEQVQVGQLRSFFR